MCTWGARDQLFSNRLCSTNFPAQTFPLNICCNSFVELVKNWTFLLSCKLSLITNYHSLVNPLNPLTCFFILVNLINWNPITNHYWFLLVYIKWYQSSFLALYHFHTEKTHKFVKLTNLFTGHLLRPSSGNKTEIFGQESVTTDSLVLLH